MRLKFIPPLMPTLVEKPPEGDGWIHEVKFDGYRSQIVRDAEGVRIFTLRHRQAVSAKLTPSGAA
jgi:bifunctional non-homologous end joining protein LigD